MGTKKGKKAIIFFVNYVCVGL